MPDEDQLFLCQRKAPRFEECLKLEPGDGPSARFSKRVGMLRANPPFTGLERGVALYPQMKARARKTA